MVCGGWGQRSSRLATSGRAVLEWGRSGGWYAHSGDVDGNQDSGMPSC